MSVHAASLKEGYQGRIVAFQTFVEVLGLTKGCCIVARHLSGVVGLRVLFCNALHTLYVAVFGLCIIYIYTYTICTRIYIHIYYTYLCSSSPVQRLNSQNGPAHKGLGGP